MVGVRLYLAQRLSAMIMAPLVLVHLVVVIYAVQDGIDAHEILTRTRGSVWWATMYGLLVAAASVHAAIGLRVIIHEHSEITALPLNILTWIIGLALLTMGSRAVIAVTL
ncbi:MAG: succinate dehydrogenase [Alphaproteobacteria bacterium]|jgi:fumarate reductase subunit C|nr:succinate dehydrogenase [Alphaproteobacteria bacterium]MBT4084579.1 succinate dehydrogenase [Alphaproteobacteria bacterium]MBT4546019.1 succinate dehydrogenase [Alphaproteobacteria bacterium]MBT7746268.1 succinate dehydrogenase [Alphaproteobacteria bacterium]